MKGALIYPSSSICEAPAFNRVNEVRRCYRFSLKTADGTHSQHSE